MEGTYQHNIDAKGRLFVPASLREELGDSFHVTISPEPCLEMYPKAEWDAFRLKISELPRLKQRKFRKFFAHAAACTLDTQGRILLPQQLREFAGLGKNVMVVGDGGRAQLWDSAKWAEVDAAETTQDALNDAFEELG
ncbi:MAG: division/cell wall cluster transcriptional repressor MraZ [Oscillospiraceae bacterium]|nr:division/cell wall cluster transcriptional repressor MraZ [Oscillospiraceae bacterium]